MADPGDETPGNPRTLKAEQDAASPLQYSRQTEDAFYGYVADAARMGHSIGFDKASGKVYEYTQKPGASSAFDEFILEGEGDGASPGGTFKNYLSGWALGGQSLFDEWQSALRDLDRETADAKAAKAAMGTARSYLDTEEDKTKEITRQFKDFDARASLLYDLMGDEQSFAMNADDQNIQNAAAREKGYLFPGEGLSYTPYISGGPLSSILSPSLPDYVRPDYRLNAAVGLPGPEGFDDPQYTPQGLPMFAYGTATQSGDWSPGAVPTSGLPGQLPSMDYPSWIASAVDRIIYNLRDGSSANDGRPGDWNDQLYGDWNTIASLAKYPSGVPQSARIALYDYVQNSTDTGGLAYSLGLGQQPSPSASDYTTVLSPSEQLAREQFEYQKQKDALARIASGRSSSSSAGGTYRASSGSSGGSSGSSLADKLAYLDASTSAQSSLEQQKFDLQKQLMLLQFELDNDPNNPKLKLQRDQLAEQIRQFDQTIALQRQSQNEATQLQRAKVIADYGANPGDAVARELYLRNRPEAVGTAVNIFSGQPGGQMTFSQMMQANAPALAGAAQSALTGTPATAAPSPTSPPPPPPDTSSEEETPQYAHGTMGGNRQITPDGWTRADKFITGDHPMGIANPELNQVRVRNGHAETKVTPLSQMLRGRMPMFADGTDYGEFDPTYWSTQAALGNTTPQTVAQTQDFYSGATLGTLPGQLTSYATSGTKGSGSKTGGVVYGAPTTANSFPAADPYAGMTSTDVITNQNSPYAGMTVEQAKTIEANADRAPAGYTVGPESGALTNGMVDAGLFNNLGNTTQVTNGGYVPASQNLDTGMPRSDYVNIANPANSGILTGAQMEAGVTQSTNPTLPGYVSPYVQQYGTPEANPDPSKTTTVSGDLAADIYTDNAAPATPPQTTTGSASGVATTAGTVKSPDGGATYNLLPGDIPSPDGFGYLRYDPVRKDYVPITPLYTTITSRDQFNALPPDVISKILSGQNTGYILSEDGSPDQWLSNLFAPTTPMLSKEQFMALPDAEKDRLLRTGYESYTPYSSLTAATSGPSMGFPTGGLTIQQDANYNDYADYMPQEELDALWERMNPTPAPAAYVPPPAANMTTTAGGAGNSPTGPQHTGPGNGAPLPPSGGVGWTPTEPLVGPSTAPPGGGSPAIPQDTGPSPATGTDPLAQALAQLFGLSYGGDTYQNLPSLQYALGNLSEGEFDTISNQPINVPALGVTLPGANSMMNYDMLNKLIQNGGFDLLNSLYTAGNVPLSLILAMAKARAPLGNAFETGLVETT